MQATGSLLSCKELLQDQRQPISALLKEHQESEYGYIPFLLAMIEQNGTYTVSEGVKALECYMPSLSNKPVNRTFTKIDFYELQAADQSCNPIAVITGDKQNSVAESFKVRTLVSRYAPNGTWQRIEYVKSKLLQPDQDIAKPWLLACLRDQVTQDNAVSFVSLAQVLFEKSQALRSFNEKCAHTLLSYADNTLRKVCAYNPNLSGVKELLSIVDKACNLDYVNPNFP